VVVEGVEEVGVGVEDLLHSFLEIHYLLEQLCGQGQPEELVYFRCREQ
jgi:hypothetical protein